MKRYNPKDIEPKWQKKWEQDAIYRAPDNSTKPKRYVLEYFPYPSGAAMHVGHVRNYTIGDVVARYARMQGQNVLHPMGWDGFGLPAENYAIEHKVSPRQAITDNVERFKKQLMQMGFSYDWSREIDSTDPNYYKWTQWFFLMLFKKGLAYQAESMQWWCPVDKTVLANEQVENGQCWRCGSVVEKKSLKQWFFKITDYADRLDKDLDDVDWSQSIKTMQRNWIGRSEGAEVKFELDTNLKGQDFVILHCFGCNSKTDFYQWLKTELTNRGAKVYAPDLPNTNKPKVEEQADYVIKNHKFTDKTTIITHSLGGPVAMKLLPKLKQPINHLIMVAPPLRTEFLDGKKRPVLNQASDWKFDFKTIKQKAGRITVLMDTKDHIVPANQPTEIAEQLGAELIAGEAQESHFEAKQEPLVLEQISPAIEVFTTRPDTLFGATFMVLAPEHPAVVKITTASEKSKVESYVKEAEKKSDIERQAEGKEKTGVFTGAYAINPVNNQKIPIWVADYVTGGYGTGAIMAVPAHDTRDWEFAKKFDLPIIRVVKNDDPDDACSYAEGVMINSGKYNDTLSQKAREDITADLAKKHLATEQTNYKMRDWLISRQRYWGAPIPIIHCPDHGAVAVPDTDLPIKLPEVKSYHPSGDGRSPLANVKAFVNTKCPKCSKPAQRETDTMDGFACSSWYFLRFADPHNSKHPFDPNKAKYWLPVDDYIGGAEHAVMHLLYARFWVKVMFDEGLISFNEPFSKLRNHGMILAPDGQKMSKSKKNTIEPDDLLNQGYGADSVRLMELFIGPWDQSANWSVESLGGTFRFLQRVWTLVQEHLQVEGRRSEVESSPSTSSGQEKQKAEGGSDAILRITHKTIKKVTEDLEGLGFNTAIASLMEMVNELYKIKDDRSKAKEWQWSLETLVQLLAPFAPHISDELWSQLAQASGSVHVSQWPKWDHKYLTSDTMTIVVQVNGKVRANIILPSDTLEKAVIESAQNDAKIVPYLKSGPKRTIYIPQKLVNFVV